MNETGRAHAQQADPAERTPKHAVEASRWLRDPPRDPPVNPHFRHGARESHDAEPKIYSRCMPNRRTLTRRTLTHHTLTRRNALSLLAASAFATTGVHRLQAAEQAESQQPRIALGRPHTDFIHSQWVPARVLTANNSQPGVSGAPLSYDAKGTRAVSVLFRYPPGWSMLRPHYVNSDQEFLILDGSLEIDSIKYGVGDYAYLPAGMQHDVMRSPTGAVVLNFYEGEHLAFYEPSPAGMFLDNKLIAHIATGSLPWTAASDLLARSLGNRVKEKILRRDSTSGECTRLVQVAADQPDKKIVRPIVAHTAVEEMFVIDGEISTPLGTMHRGGYAWRTPGTGRGPFATKTGFVALIRTKGGHADTKILARQPVAWASPLDPDVPSTMRDYARPPAIDPQANDPKY